MLENRCKNLTAKLLCTKNKKVKKLPASSPHVDGKYHPPLLDVAVLQQQLLYYKTTHKKYFMQAFVQKKFSTFLY